MFTFLYYMCELADRYSWEGEYWKSCALSKHKIPLGKSQGTLERKSNCWVKYALGIPVGGQLWLSPCTYAVRFVHIFLPWFGQIKLRLIHPVLPWTVGSGTLNAIWKESLILTILLTFQLLRYQSSESNLLFRGPDHSIGRAGQKENNLFT